MKPPREPLDKVILTTWIMLLLSGCILWYAICHMAHLLLLRLMECIP